jgi:hypothetical protein
MRNTARYNRDCAMVYTGRNGPQSRTLCECHHVFGPRVGGNVDIADGRAQKRVAHTAADEQRLMPRARERMADRARLGAGDPVIRDLHDRPAIMAIIRRMRAVAPQM